MFWQLKDALDALINISILLAALALLYALAHGLNALLKKLLPKQMGFVWHQGISNPVSYTHLTLPTTPYV